MDVGDWLRSLGLGQYRGRLSRERDRRRDPADVDGRGPEGTRRRHSGSSPKDADGDGAVPRRIGGRRRLCGSRRRPARRARPRPMVPQSAGNSPRCSAISSARPRLSARLDPEDMREVIRSYQDACSGAVARYDGFVAKFNGRRRSRLFRLSARPRRGRRTGGPGGAGHRGGRREAETRARQALKVRIGIATGIVVVGDLVGTGSTLEQAVIGDTPNLAVRLQARAEPGSVLVAEATRRLLGRAFELARLRGFVVGRAGFTIFLVS